MKTLLAFLLFIALTGCVQTLPEQVASVQAATSKACKYVPTASSVASVLTAANPAVIGVSAVANAICAAMTTKVSALVGECPKVNDVCVDGGQWLDKGK